MSDFYPILDHFFGPSLDPGPQNRLKNVHRPDPGSRKVSRNGQPKFDFSGLQNSGPKIKSKRCTRTAPPANGRPAPILTFCPHRDALFPEIGLPHVSRPFFDHFCEPPFMGLENLPGQHTV